MATKRQISSTRSIRDSTESTASLWEKIYERFPPTQQDAPFANDEKEDSLEQNPTRRDNEDYDTDSDLSPPISTTLSSLNINEQSEPWKNPTKQDHLRIIINNNENIDDVKHSLKKDLSKKGLKWTNEEEELHPWHFGLTSIHLTFTKPQMINIQMLSLSSSTPFWIKLKTEKQKYMLKNNASEKIIPHKFTLDFDISLRYGAFTDLNQFYYSPRHSWNNIEDSRKNEEPILFLFLDDHRNGGGHIEWAIQNSEMRRKKQLLVNNINDSIIVDICDEGFDIYICQKCNMNEFEANANINDDRDNDTRENGSEPNNSKRLRDSPRNFEQRSSPQRSSFGPRPAPLLCPENNKCRQQRRVFYEYYHRIGVRAGCYFPTIQFSLHPNVLGSTNNDKRNKQNRIKQILSLLIEFFLAHRIAVCYGKINSDLGPNPYLFFQENIPDFPSLLMRYSWQMLSIVGYRLQLQIDQEFRRNLFDLHGREKNADELFYRVCVYLSRMFSLKPFVNINEELQHAITESKRKRDDAAYGLIRKVDIKEDNEAYIPSVTLTPTTIRIKPLKLCRTNRVLRATEQFGKAVEHFILVDIRDENGRDLQSFHFHDLRPLLLDYLENGFTLMYNDREYKYLHHSQSQLRERQFWFYHHEKRSNLSFSDAYLWMGRFDKEQNPAKYAARMALCFSTTKATVEVPTENVRLIDDIMTKDGRLAFTDGCGTMSIKLRNKIKKSLRMRKDFSAVQFRYDGAKGVVSVHPDMPQNVDLHIRRNSMKKFDSDHTCFEVCKVSAPRPLYLNRQAILLLSYRKISDASFLILQQQNHLTLIRALLRNSDAEKLILQKTPFWFLPRDIHNANIDFIHEPFFRQLLISSCLQSTRELLQRTRIRIPPNKGRNMIGIIDEYNVLKSDQVYIQYTLLERDLNDNDDNKNNDKTKVLDNCKVVITKNPCHHPGDIRTFTAVNYSQLKHLKDVVVFSQQGDRPAPHDISGSDLDGDEYLVIWHEDLVPSNTDNAQPYNYDSETPVQTYDRSVIRDDINRTILNIAEEDCLGRLSNLHLAFADKYGVDDDQRREGSILSTVELAGAISQEVDSGKTGYHPLKENEIKKLNNALGKKRPDYMDNPNFEQYKSEHILGKLYRSSKRTLPGWNRLLRYHRHLRHLQVRTRDEPKEEEEEEEGIDNDDRTVINLDESLLTGVNRQHPAYGECAAFAGQLAFVYRQEIFEILNLYGLSHESDLWCRNSINGLTGELEDTAYTELEQLVTRTKTRFFYGQIRYCTENCDQDMPMSDLCDVCRKRQQSIAVACYCACYEGEDTLEQAPILSLPWVFAAYLLQGRLNEDRRLSEGLLSTAMKGALNRLVFEKHRLVLSDIELKFQTLRDSFIVKATVDMTVCVFIEVLQQYMGSKKHSCWPLVLSRFIQRTRSFSPLPNQPNPSNEWILVLEPHKIDEEDIYAATLLSIDWTEEADEWMHDYFQDIIDICFEEGRRTNELDFLNISENIILLLQKMAIKETIF